MPGSRGSIGRRSQFACGSCRFPALVQVSVGMDEWWRDPIRVRELMNRHRHQPPLRLRPGPTDRGRRTHRRSRNRVIGLFLLLILVSFVLGQCLYYAIT